jgi:hypothetical protein
MIFSCVIALKPVLSERSEFTDLAMEYEKIILILCEAHQASDVEQFNFMV